MGPVGFIRARHREIVKRLEYLFWGRKFLSEFGKVLLPIMRRVLPNVIAADIIGVQPMSGPAGQLFTLKHRYGIYGILDAEENIHYHWGRELQNQWNIVKKVLLS